MTPKNLEIALYLNNGSTHHYAQSDAALVQKTLGQIDQKVFAQPSLIIGGGNRSAAYAASSLIGIGFQMDGAPEALASSSSLPFVPFEMTEADYEAKQPEMKPGIPGEPLDTLVAIEFANGHRVWLEARVPQASSVLEGRQLLRNIFSMSTLLSRDLGGGATLWNVAQMVSCCLTPELEAPTDAWQAEFVS